MHWGFEDITHHPYIFSGRMQGIGGLLIDHISLLVDDIDRTFFADLCLISGKVIDIALLVQGIELFLTDSQSLITVRFRDIRCFVRI